MFSRSTRIIIAVRLFAGLLAAQQNPVTSAESTFRATAKLVTVSFQVRGGSRSGFDLKPSDVVLLEDGVPRSFTIFEAPPVHLTLDLVVMFDVTNPRLTPAGKDRKGTAGFWDTKALQDLADYWSEAIARRLLEEHGASIRFSIYRFDQFRLQRLCRSTSDPRVLVDALHRLTGPASAGQDDIPLPPGLVLRNMERKAQATGYLPQPWSLAGAISALKDSDVASSSGEERNAGGATASRALVIFSTGAEGTTITPEDLADQAITAGVPIYPVALPGFPWVLPYEGYTYRTPVPQGFYYFHASKDDGEGGNKPLPLMVGPGGAQYVKSGSGCSNCVPYFATYYNYPFEILGELTGGLRFDAINHFVTSADDTPGLLLLLHPDGYSMTGGETLRVLERVKRHSLARFSSNYVVGFVPSPSSTPHEHNLEVKLVQKSRGKLTEGKRIATY